MGGSVIITGPRGTMAAPFVNAYHSVFPDNHLVLLVRDTDPEVNKHLPPASEKVVYLPFEMSDLAQVRRTSESIAGDIRQGRLPPIEAIVQAAAIQITSLPCPRRTRDGYEEMIAVNHLAHFLQLQILLPLVKDDARIVIVGSDAHAPDFKYIKIRAQSDRLEKLINVEQGTAKEGDVVHVGRGLYSTSKLLQMMTGHELARRLRAEGRDDIRVALYNPGSMGGTGLNRDRPWLENKILGWSLRYPSLINRVEPGLNAARPADSAEMLLTLFTRPKWEQKEDGAVYIGPTGVEKMTHPCAQDKARCKELWQDTASLLHA